MWGSDVYWAKAQVGGEKETLIISKTTVLKGKVRADG